MNKKIFTPMKAWLKGGLIVAVIGFILYLLNYIIGIAFHRYPIRLIIIYPSYPLLSFFRLLLSEIWFHAPTIVIEIVDILSVIVTYFIIGSVVGFIIGKIKSKKRVELLS